MTNRQHEIILRQEQPLNKEDEISLKELLFTIIRGRKIILLTALIVLLAVTAVSLTLPYLDRLNNKGKVETAVQLYFPQISAGNGPDGRSYHPSEIKSVEVLEAAVKRANLQSRGISLPNLQHHISFEALISPETQAALERINEIEDETLKLEELEALPLNPSSYIMTLTVANSLRISIDEARRLSDAIVYAYKDWLIRTYNAMTELPSAFDSDVNLEDYDYIQAADILNTQLAQMENYVDTSAGMSGTNAEQREEIRDVLGSIRSVEMEVLYTNIAAHYLTKDPQKIEAVYQQMVTDQKQLAAQKAEEADALMNTIVNWRDSREKIIIGDVRETTLELKTASGTYDQLILDYTAAKNRESRARAEADYYTRQGERFANASQEKLMNGASTLEAQQALQSIRTIKEKLVYWTNEINRINTEDWWAAMYQRYAEQIVPAGVYRQENSVNLLMNMAIALAAGLLIGTLAVLLKEFLKDDSKEENR